MISSDRPLSGAGPIGGNGQVDACHIADEAGGDVNRVGGMDDLPLLKAVLTSLGSDSGSTPGAGQEVCESSGEGSASGSLSEEQPQSLTAEMDVKSQRGASNDKENFSQGVQPTTSVKERQAAFSRSSSSGSANSNPVKPVRIFKKPKPKIAKEEVEATDKGYASVQKLSQWLSADPFEKKKKGPIRKGAKVIAKARVFEKDMDVVDRIESDQTLKEVDVSDKKKWLKEAFKKEEEEGKEDSTKVEIGNKAEVSDKKKWLQEAFKKADDQKSDSSLNSANRKKLEVSEKKKLLQDAFKKEEENAESSPKGEICNKAEVSDKKKWLEEAFKKDEENSSPKAENLTKAEVSDKKKWLEEAFKKEQENRSATPKAGAPTAAEVSEKKKLLEEAFVKKEEEEKKKEERAKKDEVTDKKKWLEEAFKKGGGDSPKEGKEVGVVVDVSDKKKWLQEAFNKPKATESEEAGERDGEAPSEADVNDGTIKSVTNKFGGAVQPKTGVQKMRALVEKREKEAKKMSDPTAFHKASWSSGEFHGNYKKKVVDSRGIAPKKNLNDLP